jgi:peptidoglycan biosynthesis protein MviN/MurJ (putative lipid II flippase)
LALAAAVANTVNAVQLFKRMERRLGAPLLAPLMAPLLRITGASCLMGAGCWMVRVLMADAALAPWIGLPVLMVSGLIFYLIACRLIGVRELSTVIRCFGKIPVLQSFVSA